MGKKSIWLLALAFVVLLGGAALLYDRLSGEYAPEQLAVEQTPVPAATPDPSAPAPTGTPAPQTGESAQQDEADDRRAPDFTAYDADGNAVQLSDYFGKPLVLNFWASWCGPCKSEMPEFQKAYEEYPDLQFLMVNMTTGRETQASAEELLEQEGYTFPVLFDLDTDAAMTYGVYSLPTTYVLDAEGNLVAWGQGALDAETLQRGIDMILPENGG